MTDVLALASGCGYPVDWLPALTFASPGDLSVAYNTQVGKVSRVGDGGAYLVSVRLLATPTFTTASGALRLLGCPLTIYTMNGSVGTFAGITKAGYTQIGLSLVTTTQTIFAVIASSPGLANSSIVAADITSGAPMQLNFQVWVQPFS